MKRYSNDEEKAYGEIKVEKARVSKVKKTSQPMPTTNRKYANADGGYVQMDYEDR